MFIIFDSANSQWADKDHTCLYARIKTSNGWENLTCHKYSTGIEKEVWDAREDFEFLPANDETSPESLHKLIQKAVQDVLEAKAREKEYDNVLSIATYATSTDPVYHAQGVKFVKWRDECWRYCTDIENNYKAGVIPMPTFDEIMKGLPTMEWDDDDIQSE